MKRKIFLFTAVLVAIAGINNTNIKANTEAAKSPTIIFESHTYTYTNTEINSNLGLSENEVKLIARITMAEAEGESETGKRLVVDTILNRVDSDRFPNTVYGVIYQPGQFTPVTNGRLERCFADEKVCSLVCDELNRRTNSDVIFFNAGGYSRYGTPLFKEGNHYFSGLK